MRLSELVEKASEATSKDYPFIQAIFYYFNRSNKVLNPIVEERNVTELQVTFGSRRTELVKYIPVENKERALEEMERGAKLLGLRITSIGENAFRPTYKVKYDITQEQLMKFVGLIQWYKWKERYSL